MDPRGALEAEGPRLRDVGDEEVVGVRLALGHRHLVDVDDVLAVAELGGVAPHADAGEHQAQLLEEPVAHLGEELVQEPLAAQAHVQVGSEGRARLDDDRHRDRELLPPRAWQRQVLPPPHELGRARLLLLLCGAGLQQPPGGDPGEAAEQEERDRGHARGRAPWPPSRPAAIAIAVGWESSWAPMSLPEARALLGAGDAGGERWRRRW